MIQAIASLLVCQLLGEILVHVFALPLPGPVVGMGFLFAALLFVGRGQSTAEPEVPADIGRVADVLLRNLSLLFIPAAVGIIQSLDLVRAYAGTIALAISLSTIAALAVTALTFRTVARLVTPRLGKSVDTPTRGGAP